MRFGSAACFRYLVRTDPRLLLVLIVDGTARRYVYLRTPSHLLTAGLLSSLGNNHTLLWSTSDHHISLFLFQLA